jgi:ribosomal protein S27AE
MQIFVNCLGETKLVKLNDCTDLLTLEDRVACEFDITNSIALYRASARFNSTDELVEGETLSAVISVLGGAGKKRKAFTTPKKNKHKHKNTKLMALSYYAIKGDGTVERTRKLCEQETCKGKGIFMANHWNRYYCGNCALTLLKKDAPKEEPKKAKPDAPKVQAEGGKKNKK